MTYFLQQDAIGPLAENGFLSIPVSGEVQRAIELTFRAAKNFFSLSEEEKLKGRLPFDCGYRPPGIEYSASSDQPDAIESFTTSMRTCEQGCKLQVVEAFELHETMIAIFALLEPLAEAVASEFARTTSGRGSRNLPKGAFNRWSRLQLNYATRAHGTSQFINELHEDGHLLTIACATGPGLELLTNEQQFVCPVIAPANVIVMPGKVAWLLSGGYIMPLYHRVRRVEEQQERMSLLFFGDIDPLNCNPWIYNNNNIGVDIGQCVLTNYSRFGLSDFPIE